MATPSTLILTGYGINCDDETKFTFEKAGAKADIIHINDLIKNKSLLKKYQIFMFPGGFSYGDDTGSGNALANRIKNNFIHELQEFIEKDSLLFGICNGFQVMVNIGILPAFNEKIGTTEVALEYNKTFRYQCRWVDLEVNEKASPIFLKGIDRLHIPVAHGEGNFYAPEAVIKEIESKNMVAFRYVKSDYNVANGEFPYNPNGSINDIAGIADTTGKVLGLMPHPERGMFFTQRDDWTYLKEEYIREGKDLPEDSEGFKIFKNAVEYFKER